MDSSLRPIVDNSEEDVQLVTDILGQSTFSDFPILILLIEDDTLPTPEIARGRTTPQRVSPILKSVTPSVLKTILAYSVHYSKLSKARLTFRYLLHIILPRRQK